MNTFLYYLSAFSIAYTSFTLLFFALHTFLQKPTFGFIARCLASYVSLLICAIYGVLASVALRLVGKHRLGQWTTARAFKYIMYLTTGVRFEIVSGAEYLSRSRPVVIIGNHQTELDVLLLGEVFPPYCSVTAKKSLRNIPFLGWFMALSGTVFLDRARKEQALKAFDGAAKEMREHRQTVFIFTEGTRSYAREPRLLPFKKGAFHLAVQAGVPIVPVVCENYSKVLDIKARRFESGTIRVKVLPPIPTVGLETKDVDDLTRDTREKMLKVLEEMAREPAAKAVDGTAAENAADGVAKATGSDIKPEL